jgi:exodeoxyribonuclease VII large subunit
MYFILKDESSQLRIVMFRGNNRFLRFKPRDGQKILVRGRISVYAARGEYQLIADLIEPRGIGELQLAFQELKERLTREGLFDADKKKPIPDFPSVIGLVTSPTGAAVQDMIRILFRRFPCIRVLLHPVKVQGEGAAEEIASGIAAMNRDGRADVIIIGRGGGSIEDLWAFNEEVVARSIHESEIPVISAVGHEIDFTISDFTADLRAPTPSAAAELVVPDKEELQNSINHLFSRSLTALKQSLRQHSLQMELLFKDRGFLVTQQKIRENQQLMDELIGDCIDQISRNIENRHMHMNMLTRNLVLLNPQMTLDRKIQRFITTGDRFQKSVNRLLEKSVSRFDQANSNLSVLSPLNILERGYSVVRKFPDKNLIKQINQLEKKDIVEILLHDGLAKCQVMEIFPDGQKQLGDK